MKSHWQMFAGYNAWANRRLYEVAARLSDEDYRADRGAFFKSVHGTLNHLLVADRIWLGRFMSSKEPPPRLDAIVCDRFADLRVVRDAEDARIIAFIEARSEADFAATFRYRAVTAPAEFEQDLGSALAHVFNHQTHHRGQVHCLLTGLVNEAPPLDFLIYQREAEKNIRPIA